MLLDVMNAIYYWVDAIINNPDDPDNPELAIIPSHENIPAPTSTKPYITIDYAPALSTLGKADWSVTQLTEDTFQYKLRTDFEGTVEIWETNGIGEYLYKLVSSQWIPEANDYLRENNISFLRNNDIITIPSLQTDSKWSKESVVEIVFGFGAGITYNTDVVENIEGTGTLENPDGTEKTRDFSVSS